MTKMSMVVILDNLRSIENVGSIFRTADALGIDQLILCGTTPHPHPDESWRRDHLALKKTALGAELSVPWEYQSSTAVAIKQLKSASYHIIALETDRNAQSLETVTKLKKNIALILGNEVTGIAPETLALADEIIQIPMSGTKESLNVAVSFGIAAFWLRYRT